MKTAVEHFLDDLIKHRMISLSNSQINYSELQNLIQKNLEIEKEQAKQICMRTIETDDIPISGTMNDYFNDVFNYVINKQQEQ
jgi:6-phosphofructokinase